MVIDPGPQAYADEDDELAEDTPSDIPLEPEPEPEPEPCETVGDFQPCDEDRGGQFCFRNYQHKTVWTECLPSYACIPGEERECDFGSVTCRLDSEGIPDFPGCPWTPLVLSFDASPIEFASNAASFAMDNAGMCLNTDWPAAHNPWLAIDLDRNGFIDGGHELFGSGFVLDSGRLADNGFLALASLDSNRDGTIDASDARFTELLVWRDADGDKISRPGELTSLADEGIEAIDLDYAVRERCDPVFNCGRERANFAFTIGGRQQVGEVVDVHLPCH